MLVYVCIVIPKRVLYAIYIIIKVQDFLLFNVITTSHRVPYIFLVTTVGTTTMDDTTTDLITTIVETTSF